MMHPIVAHDSLHPVTVTYTLQQDLLQESDAQERRWLLALELYSYFIPKLLKKPSFSSSSIKVSSKKLFYSVCYRAT